MDLSIDFLSSLQEEEENQPPPKSLEVPVKPVEKPPIDRELWQKHFSYITKKLEKSTRKHRRMFGNVTVSEQLENIIERTFLYQENQSVVLIGQPGMGKKLLVHDVITRICSKPGAKLKHVVVTLDGLVLNSEVAAFRMVMNQLNSSNVHDPSALDQEDDIQLSKSTGNSSFQHLYNHLKHQLMEFRALNIPVVFIFDHFDFFVSKMKQVLLYNLLDWMQSDAFQFVVIGLTSSLPFTEKLEKRVQSRFSNHQLVVLMMEFELLTQLISDQFVLDEEVLLSEEHAQARQSYDAYVKDWIESKPVRQSIQKYYDQGKSIKWFMRLTQILKQEFLYKKKLPRSAKAMNQLIHATLEPFAAAVSDTSYTLQLLQAISTRELMFLLALGRLEGCYDQVNFTFEMIYEQYLVYKRQQEANSASVTMQLTRNDGLKAMENLVRLHLVKKLVPAQPVQPEYHMFQLIDSPEHLHKYLLADLVACPVAIKNWALRAAASST